MNVIGTFRKLKGQLKVSKITMELYSHVDAYPFIKLLLLCWCGWIIVYSVM